MKKQNYFYDKNEVSITELGLSSTLTELKNSRMIPVEDWNNRIKPLLIKQIHKDQLIAAAYMLMGTILYTVLIVGSMITGAILLHISDLPIFCVFLTFLSGLAVLISKLSFLAGKDRRKRSCDLTKIINTAQRQLNPSYTNYGTFNWFSRQTSTCSRKKR